MAYNFTEGCTLLVYTISNEGEIIAIYTLIFSLSFFCNPYRSESACILL